jgi:hypothetical protein
MVSVQGFDDHGSRTRVEWSVVPQKNVFALEADARVLGVQCRLGGDAELLDDTNADTPESLRHILEGEAGAQIRTLNIHTAENLSTDIRLNTLLRLHTPCTADASDEVWFGQVLASQWSCTATSCQGSIAVQTRGFAHAFNFMTFSLSALPAEAYDAVAFPEDSIPHGREHQTLSQLRERSDLSSTERHSVLEVRCLPSPHNALLTVPPLQAGAATNAARCV